MKIFVKIRGKGDKERLVPISDDLSTILKEYTKYHVQNSEYFFESKRKTKFSPLTIQLMVKNMHNMRVSTKTSLRISFAIHLQRSP